MSSGLSAEQLYEVLAESAPNHNERQADIATSGAISRIRITEMLEEAGLSDEARAYLESDVIETSSQKRLSEAWEKLSPTLRLYSPAGKEGLVDKVLVRNLGTATVAAFAMDASDSSLIVVDDATHDLTYEIIKAAFASWVMDEGDLRADANTVARTVRATLGHLRHYGQLWQPFHVRLSGTRLFFVLEVIDAAMDFILAHEYAHIALGHTQTSERRLNFGPDANVVDCVNETQELAADIFATNVVVNPTRKKEVNLDEAAPRLLGIQFALETIDLLDDCFFVRRSVGHPSPAIRFQVALMACGLQEEGRTKEGPMGILSIAEAFRAELKRVDLERDDLLAAVTRDPLVSLASDYDDEDLSLLESLEHLESVIILPPSVSFSWLAQLVFDPEVLRKPDPLIRKAAEEEYARLELESDADKQMQIDFIIKSAAGLGWLLLSLPTWKDVDWAVSFMSPSPGRPYYEWLEEVGDIIPSEIFGAVSVCVQHLRNRGLASILPFSNEFVNLVHTWVRLQCLDRVSPGVPRPQ